MKEKNLIQTEKKSFNDIMLQAEDIQSTVVDYDVQDIAKSVRVTDELNLAWRTDPWGFHQFEQGLSQWALSQLGNKVGVPGGYLNRCVEGGLPSLAAETSVTQPPKKGRKPEGKRPFFVSVNYRHM